MLDELSRVPRRRPGAAVRQARTTRCGSGSRPQRLTSLNLDAVRRRRRRSRAQNVQAPVGRIGARPITDDQQFQLNVQTQGRLATPEQFGNIVLRANPDGSVLRVARRGAGRDRARRTRTPRRGINGQPAVGDRHLSAPGANAVGDRRCGRKHAGEAVGALPRGAEVPGASTTPPIFVTDTIEEVMQTLVEAFVLVVIVVFLFLGSLRATHHPGDRRAGQPDRHLRRAAG